METKELKINVPEGYEIDKENSTFGCIRFKPSTSWRYTTDDIAGYYIDVNSSIIFYRGRNQKINYNLFATKAQVKSALAMARISQIMANDERFGGVVADDEWNNTDIKFVIRRRGNIVDLNTTIHHWHFLAFHTIEQAQLFLKENEDLVNDYLMLPSKNDEDN